MRSKTEAVVGSQRRGNEHQQEVHRQWVKLIRWRESDDCRSQSLGLAEQSVQHRNATRFP